MSKLEAQSISFKLELQNHICAENVQKFSRKSLTSMLEKLENDHVYLEFKVMSLKREIEHLKTTYNVLFDSVKPMRAQFQHLKGKNVDTKFVKPSILGKPPSHLLKTRFLLRLMNNMY